MHFMFNKWFLCDMGIIKAYGIVVIISVFKTAVAICLWNTTCQCGISNSSMSLCLDLSPRSDDPCATWTNCATCRSDSKACLSCPEDRSGTTCDQNITSGNEESESFLSQKRDRRNEKDLKNTINAKRMRKRQIGLFYFLMRKDEEPEEDEYSDEEDQVTYCQSPGLIDNGHWTVLSYFNNGDSPPNDEDDEFPERTRIKFFCEDGYSMVGGFPTMYCQHNGFWSAETPFCHMECGYTLLHSLRKVYSGVNTLPGEWPWTVAISKISGIFSTLSCGASLLDTRTVLTAAHCLMNPDLENTVDVRLYFGKYNRSDWRDDDEVVIRTPSIFMIHPKYDAKTKDNDIALIRFEPPITYSKRIRPVCLPTKETSEQNLKIGRSGYVVGWGTTEKNLESEQLLMALVPVLPGPECMSSFEMQDISMLITRNMFCAGFPEGRVASCTGDSGGPLVFHDPQTDRHTIEGIVSFGRQRECGMPHRYTVYTKVSRYIRWIKEAMAMSGEDEVPTYCERPGRLDNGQWSVVFDGGRTDSQNSAEEEFPQNTTLEFACRDGFSMVGSPILECLSSGYWSEDTPVCKVVCGYSVERDQHPWMVQLTVFRAYQGPKVSTTCRGVLINDTTVLSVAHCLTHARLGLADKVRLYFGEHDPLVRTRTVIDEWNPFNRSKATGVTINGFDFYDFENDIALVRFALPIEFSRGIRPVCLPTRRTSEQNLKPGNIGYAIDWGQSVLELPVISSENCFRSIKNRNVSDLIAKDSLFCAGFKASETDKLNSGRPLVFEAEDNKRFTVEGVATEGISSRYYVFTKVSAYLHWIKTT